jgi:hypothetical protein
VCGLNNGMENAQEFDPYQHWLGIPVAEQPPNHYRLLGIHLFEADPAAIERAAQQRMMSLRSIELETHVELAQRLLKEVAVAGACLLTPERKQRYDLALRAQLAPKSPPSQNTQTDQAATGQRGAGAKRSKPPAMSASGFSTVVADLLDELPKREPAPEPPGRWDEWKKKLTHVAYVLIGIVVAALVLTLIVWIIEQFTPQDFHEWISHEN